MLPYTWWWYYYRFASSSTKNCYWKKFASKFKDDPIKAVEGVIGVDLPDKEIEKVVTAVKTKLKLDESGITDKLKGLFK